MLNLQNRAKIVVLASHSEDNVIRQMCNKALWMDHGHIRAFGPVDLYNG